MKTCLVLALSVVFGATGAAFAQPGAGALPMAVIFNESCVGYSTMDSQFSPMDCSVLPDAFGQMVPTFFLPQPVVAGDILIIHADGTPTDLIRFPDDGGGMTIRMLYYSDPEPNEPNAPKSDVPFPPDFDPAAVITVIEAGNLDTFDWFSYSPDMNTLYMGISDSQLQPPL